jgi:hypothetical protein
MSKILLPDMPLYEKEWWKKIFAKKQHQKKVDTVKDIEAIIEFLNVVKFEAKEILPELSKLKELEKEREVARSGIRQINLETQAKILDKVIEKYEFFQNDVDINGLRVKIIARQFLKNAEKEGMKDLIREKNKNSKWKFLW